MQIKLFLCIWFTVMCTILKAQTTLNSDSIEEYSFYISDTTHGLYLFGNYKPKDILKLEDGSLLIGTEFSIPWTHQFNNPRKYHHSSGSIFKLNAQFIKEWEIAFDDQRIERILKTRGGKILVIGEYIQSTSIWMAEIDKNGNLLWKKDYKYKSTVGITDVVMDKFDNLYILATMVHYEIARKKNSHEKKPTKRRPKDRIAAIKISSRGNRKWTKTLNQEKIYVHSGKSLILYQNNIHASFIYRNSNIPITSFNTKVIQLTKKGKIKSQFDFYNKNIIHFDSGYIGMTSHATSKLILYNANESTDSMNVQSSLKAIRINNIVKTTEGHLFLGTTWNKNTDCILGFLTPQIQFQGYYAYSGHGEYSKYKDAIILNNGDILILAECFKKMSPPSDPSISYINLVRIKKGTLQSAVSGQ